MSPAGSAQSAAGVRLFQLIYNDDLHATGMTDVFEVICEKALARGWTFEVIAPEISRGSVWGRVLAERGGVLHYIPEGTRRERADHMRTILAPGPDQCILHTHGTSYDIPAALAARGRDDIAVFWHVHSFLPSGFKASTRLRLKFKGIGRNVDRVVAQSVNIRDSLLRVGVPKDRIVMFSSGIEPDRFPLRTPEEHAAERRRLEIPDSAYLLLHFGWDWEIKGTDRLLAALRVLVDSDKEVIALLNRGGERARREAESLGLSDHIRIGELVQDTRPLYTAADCMVAPSRGEGMPFSLVEALATGTSVVASDLPGHRYLADNIDSCRVSGTDPEALAAGIAEVMARSEDQVSAEAAQAHGWIAANLNVADQVDGLFESYERVLAEHAPGG